MSQLPPARRISLAPFVADSGSAEPAISLSVHEGGEGPAVVLCHGFPELAYSWRHQYQHLVEAGFRVVIPDQRGYGGSDAPDGIETGWTPPFKPYETKADLPAETSTKDFDVPDGP